MRKNPAYTRKRDLCISAKDPCTYPQKRPLYFRRILQISARTHKRLIVRSSEREKETVLQTERESNERRRGGRELGERTQNGLQDQPDSKDNDHSCMTKQSDHHVCACGFLWYIKRVEKARAHATAILQVQERDRDRDTERQRERERIGLGGRLGTVKETRK